jgi:hypothetical protein
MIFSMVDAFEICWSATNKGTGAMNNDFGLVFVFYTPGTYYHHADIERQTG